jgi:hypothetical protein
MHALGRILPNYTASHCRRIALHSYRRDNLDFFLFPFLKQLKWCCGLGIVGGPRQLVHAWTRALEPWHGTASRHPVSRARLTTLKYGAV